MNKKITVLLSVLLVVSMLLGACAVKQEEDTSTPGPVPDNNAAIVVAEVNGEPIYKSDYDDMFARIANSMGVTNDAELANNPQMQTLVLDNVIAEKVVMAKITEKGYMDFTSEELADAEKKAQESLDYYIQYQLPTIQQELGEGYTEEQLQAKVKEYEQQILDDAGITREELVEQVKYMSAVEKAMKDLVGDEVATGEESKAQYDEYVAADETAFTENIAAYEQSLAERTVYYVPEGIRMVRHVLIKLTDEQVSKIRELRIAEDNEGADALLQENLKEVKPEADEVLSKLQSGELTFDQAIEQHNDDPGMTSNPQGYMIYADSTSYVAPFKEGAMSLTQVGEITGLVATDYGYHIIEYTSDKPHGPVEYEVVKDEIAQTLTLQKQEQAWADQVEEWKKDFEIVTHEDVL